VASLALADLDFRERKVDHFNAAEDSAKHKQAVLDFDPQAIFVGALQFLLFTWTGICAFCGCEVESEPRSP
jgi:hypothetical protein